MYRDLGALWNGFAKNAVEILGSGAASVAAAAAAAAIAWAAVLLPIWSGLETAHAVSVFTAIGFALCLLSSLTLVAVHFGTIRHCRLPPGYLLLFPAAYTAVAALACFSLALRWTGRVRWKGRTYRVPRGASARWR